MVVALFGQGESINQCERWQRGRHAVRRFQLVSFDKEDERVRGPALAERNWRQQIASLSAEMGSERVPDHRVSQGDAKWET